MRNYIGNAFSLQMLNLKEAHRVKISPCDPGDIPKNAVSCIGHADTASVVSSILGWEVPVNRMNVKLDSFSVLYVAQLTGGRLPEGSTTLPDGFTLQFVKIELEG